MHPGPTLAQTRSRRSTKASSIRLAQAPLSITLRNKSLLDSGFPPFEK